MRIQRGVLWAGLAVVVAAGIWYVLSPGDTTQPPPYNVILISIDTLRADHLGVYGYKRNTSPRLDRLAERSTVFTRAVAQAPNTKPSHASLFTSLYYSVHRVVGDQETRIPEWRVTLPEILRDHGFATWGVVDGGYLRSAFGFNQGFDHFEDPKVGITRILENVDRWLDENRARPFFMFIHCYDVHAPYAPPPPFDTQFEESPYTGDFEPNEKNLRELVPFWRDISQEDLQHVIVRYDGGIRYTDEQFGRFFESLKRRNLLESTIVVVLSDHGEEFKEHGSMLHWQTHFMPNLHVPLFFFIPGRQPQIVDEPVELIDVLPTVLDLLGLPPHPEAMGRSLVPLMDGRRTGDEGLWVAYGEPFNLGGQPVTVVSDRYQLFYDVTSGRIQLFDTRSDPRATVDLAEREPEVTQRLLSALGERQRWIEAAKQKAPDAPTEAASIDEDTRRELEALGYIEESD
jgi:arylsulfatase A-like enzyme